MGYHAWGWVLQGGWGGGGVTVGIQVPLPSHWAMCGAGIKVALCSSVSAHRFEVVL